ncbi:ferredoxin, partial [Candidatus Pacearchaeota archaeon CG09_land_8_20_14_0_10_30_9]
CCGGICGTCKIKVLKGIENINPKTEEEMEFQLEKNERLACQCHKIKGDIEIDYEEW